MYAIGLWLGIGHHTPDKAILKAMAVAGGDGADAGGINIYYNTMEAMSAWYCNS